MKRFMKNTGYLFMMICLVVGLLTIPAQGATEEEIEASIEAGVTYLVAQQNTTPGPYFGSWYAYSSREAGTGLALYKLCDRAYELQKTNPEIESPFDEDYEYSQNIIDGFDWLFKHLTIVNINSQDHTGGASGTVDDPDVNGNGTGICVGYNTYRESYYTGIILAAIASSGTFDRMISDPASPVDGWTFGEVAQDMVDFLAFAQVDSSTGYGGMVEGGWDYRAVDNGSGGSGWKGDQSNSGYAALGLGEAQYFGCAIPDWVKVELNWWIDWVQDDITGDEKDGGSWYSYPGDGINVNTLKTGNLIFQMALVGDTPDDQRVIDALDYLSRHWNDPSGGNLPPGWNGNPAQLQAMFCIMKGLEYMGIETFNSIDWFDEFSTVLVAQQYLTADPNYGAWLLSSGRSEIVINTEWALLTLQRVAPPPPFIPVFVDIKPQSCPNPLNTKGKGVLPVAILGTEEFDVSTIDPSTINLEGVFPLRWALEDVATPFDGEECECTTEGSDGFMDLTIKFDTQEIIGALGDVVDGEVRPLYLTGNLIEEFGGTGIEGSDCVIIKAKNLGKELTVSSSDVPEEYALFENFPNPFNPITTIQFAVPEQSFVKLEVYNSLGERVTTLVAETLAAGIYSFNWNAINLPSGVYIYSIQSKDFFESKKMILMK